MEGSIRHTRTGPVAAVLPACQGLPDRANRIAGVPRVERLTRTLEKRGFRVIMAADAEAAAGAELVVPDCHVLLPEGEVHLCTEGVKVAEKQLVASLRKPIDGLVSRN